jgi:hypothetical protein
MKSQKTGPKTQKPAHMTQKPAHMTQIAGAVTQFRGLANSQDRHPVGSRDKAMPSMPGFPIRRAKPYLLPATAAPRCERPTWSMKETGMHQPQALRLSVAMQQRQITGAISRATTKWQWRVATSSQAIAIAGERRWQRPCAMSRAVWDSARGSAREAAMVPRDFRCEYRPASSPRAGRHGVRGACVVAEV